MVGAKLANTRGGGRMEAALRNDGNVLMYVVRHGETELNKENKFRGFNDVPLDDSGRSAAEKAGESLKDVPFRHIYSSDMQRSVETAQAINRNGADYHTLPELRPLHVGHFAGQPKTPENKAAIEHYVQNSSQTIPGGESLSDFKSRIRPAINGIVSESQYEGTPALLVAHSSTIHELGDMFHGNHLHAKVKPGGIVKVTLENGKPHVSIVSGEDTDEKDRIS